jgi:hypothetical protein
LQGVEILEIRGNVEIIMTSLSPVTLENLFEQILDRVPHRLKADFSRRLYGNPVG